jgi:hypothetical protein
MFFVTAAIVGMLYYSIGPQVEHRLPEHFGPEENHHELSMMNKVMLKLWHLQSAVYMGLFELFQGAPLHSPMTDTGSRRCISLGWQFFVLMFATAYLANLAAFLTKIDVTIPFANVKECIDGGCNFCTYDHGPTNDALSVYHPTLKTVRDPTWSKKAKGGKDFSLFTNLGKDPQEHSPRCDATWSYDVFGHDFNYITKMKEYGEQCNVKVVDPPLFTLPVAFPINPKYAKAMNHYIQKAINEGVWETLKEKYRPVNPCGDWLLDTKAFVDEADDAQMTPDNFLGVECILGVFVILAVLLAFANKCSKWACNQRHQQTAQPSSTTDAPTKLDIYIGTTGASTTLDDDPDIEKWCVNDAHDKVQAMPSKDSGPVQPGLMGPVQDKGRFAQPDSCKGSTSNSVMLYNGMPL